VWRKKFISLVLIESTAHSPYRKTAAQFAAVLVHITGGGLDRLSSLGGMQFGIQSIFRHQLCVGSPFLDLPVREHHNLIGMTDGAQPVGDDQGGPILGQLFKGFLDLQLRGCIQG